MTTAKEQADLDKRAKAEAAARKKIEDARKLQEDERAAHRATLEQEAKASASELDKMMEELSVPEQRQVRLRAYLHTLSSDWASEASSLQATADGFALRLARYMVTGRV